jgi:hypothetical protein
VIGEGDGAIGYGAIREGFVSILDGERPEVTAHQPAAYPDLIDRRPVLPVGVVPLGANAAVGGGAVLEDGDDVTEIVAVAAGYRFGSFTNGGDGRLEAGIELVR